MLQLFRGSYHGDGHRQYLKNVYVRKRFLERSIATFSFDGPGQGEGEYDFHMCPEYEEPVAAVIKTQKNRIN